MKKIVFLLNPAINIFVPAKYEQPPQRGMIQRSFIRSTEICHHSI
jgi:hypothetical protein